ncbi:DNRLRE domain-containing protein [Sphaerisporangium corydalis]|uniref:DNRLRE domain-containing protein n=1 Tax=Sphaerisporangium corydalis TaxID=1441875 RepID=A0ABV9EGU9_9ACTN|nr:DNRLRE domain-containing protein [Sphaerisporangium corydalis]
MVASLLAAGGPSPATADTSPPSTQSTPAKPAVPAMTALPRPVDPDAAARAAITQARKLGKPVEVDQAGTEGSRTWAYPDAHLVTEAYSAPSRVKQPDGTWAWMNTALVERNGVLTPTVAKAKVEFSLGGNGPFATMRRDDGQRFALSWGGTLPRPTVKDNVATYADAAGPSADLVVTALSTGFTHDVVLRERPTGPVEYRIPVQTTGMDFGKNEQGGLQLTDAKDKVLAQAPRPVMLDASAAPPTGAGAVTGRRVGRISTSVVNENGRQVLVLKPDAAWLKDPATHYPVTIDPTTTLSVTTDTTIGSRAECAIFDPLVSSQSTLLTIGGKVWTCSGRDAFQYYRSYLKFDTAALTGKAILSAALQLWRTQSFKCAVAGDGTVQAGRVISDWAANTISWSNKPPTADPAWTPCPTTSPNTPGAMSWPATDWVRKWAVGTPNYGIELIGPSESLVNNADSYTVSYHSSEMTGAGATPPKLIVQYFLPPEIPTVTAESVDSVDGDQAIVRTSSAKVGYQSTSADGRNLDYYLSILDSTAPLPPWTTGAGAVAQWSFTEGITHVDGTGNHHDLAFITGRSTVINGKDGKAIQLNGAPTVGADASVLGPVLHTDKSFSVAGWVRADTTATTTGGIFNQRGPTQDGFTVTYDGNTRKYRLTMYNTGAANSSGTSVTSTTATTSGTWNHVTAVYDATAHKIRLYINGVLSGEATHNSTWDSWFTGSTFNLSPSGGLLTSTKTSYDEVRAYQRALSQAEISWMLNLTPPTNANLPSGQSATKTYDVSNVDSFKISVKACINGVTPQTCSESPYYRITTDAPYLPTDTETGLQDPIQPILSGMANRPSGGLITAKFFLYSSAGVPIGAAPLGTRTVNGGQRASFQVPSDLIQAGTAYRWQMQACVEEICSAKTPSVAFTSPGTPPPDPVENVRHLTLGMDSIVIKTANPDPAACDGGPCTVVDSATMRIGGTGSDKTAAVIGLRLNELPDGAGISEGILKLGTPICPTGPCPQDAVITATPLKSPVTSETRGSDLLGDVDTRTTTYTLPLNQPQADIAGSEYSWLMLTADKDDVITFGDAAAAEKPSLDLTYLLAGPPSEVLNLVTQPGDAAAIASWGLPESNGSVGILEGYDVEVANSGGAVVKTLVVEDPFANITGLTNGEVYNIRVRAKTAFAVGEWVSATVTPKVVPPPPSSDASQSCVPFLDGPPASANTKTVSDSGAGEYVQRVRDYYQAQDAVLEGRAETVWDAAGVTPDAPSAAKLSLLNTALVLQRGEMERVGESRTDSAVALDNAVVQPGANGSVRVTVEVKRTWKIQTAPSAKSMPGRSRTADQIDPSESTISIVVFDRCGNMVILQVPNETVEDPTDVSDDDGWNCGSGQQRMAEARSCSSSGPGLIGEGVNLTFKLGKTWEVHYRSGSSTPRTEFDELEPWDSEWPVQSYINYVRIYPKPKNASENSKYGWQSDYGKYLVSHAYMKVSGSACFRNESYKSSGDLNVSTSPSFTAKWESDSKEECGGITEERKRGSLSAKGDPQLNAYRGLVWGKCAVTTCSIDRFRHVYEAEIRLDFKKNGTVYRNYSIRADQSCPLSRSSSWGSVTFGNSQCLGAFSVEDLGPPL